MYSHLLDGIPLLGLLIGVVVITSSCKSDPGSIFKDGHSGKPIVLVAGYSGTNGTNHVAKYWMDGQEAVLKKQEPRGTPFEITKKTPLWTCLNTPSTASGMTWTF